MLARRPQTRRHPFSKFSINCLMMLQLFLCTVAAPCPPFPTLPRTSTSQYQSPTWTYTLLGAIAGNMCAMCKTRREYAVDRDLCFH